VHVLLVGGTGFLGGHVARALLAAGHRVTAIGRGLRQGAPGAETLALDRRDVAALRRALDNRRFDFTVDLAAYEASDVDALFQIRGLTLGPYVLISTGQVYLVTTSRDMPYREDQSRAPLMPEPPPTTPDHREWTYGIGKRRAESAMIALRAYGVRSVILRLPVLIGEGDTSLRLWSCLERLMDGGPILLPDGGATPLRFLHPGDVGRVIARFAESGLPHGPVYNLAQPDLVTLRSTIEGISAAAGITPRMVDVPLDEIERSGIARAFSPYSGPWVSVLDPARAEAEWAFEGTPMTEYLPAVVRWHLENRPTSSHAGYRHRPRERKLAESVRAGIREVQPVRRAGGNAP
jgi:nucleoside-diphosphate-sugar epimerase